MWKLGAILPGKTVHFLPRLLSTTSYGGEVAGVIDFKPDHPYGQEDHA